MMSSELNECLGAQEKQWLFSKLPDVKDVSEKYVDRILEVSMVAVFFSDILHLSLFIELIL